MLAASFKTADIKHRNPPKMVTLAEWAHRRALPADHSAITSLDEIGASGSVASHATARCGFPTCNPVSSAAPGSTAYCKSGPPFSGCSAAFTVTVGRFRRMAA
jgi:hypothetical protein